MGLQKTVSKITIHDEPITKYSWFEAWISDTTSAELLEAKVKVISNEECAILGKYNFKSSGDLNRFKLNRTLPEGIADELLCSIGLDPDNDGKYTVSLLF